MSVKLMELETSELLRKYGAGNHKPGSGSAAANLGLVSAQLLLTVINLTDQPKRQSKYSTWLPELRRMGGEIENRILPCLERLFQIDSEQFDKAIILRQERDLEPNLQRKTILAHQAIDELKLATDLPIEIAKLCCELAEIARYVFLHAFKSARGDAGVAQQAAIAGIGGCISIINLNLLSFRTDQWTAEVRRDVKDLRNKYTQFLQEANNCLVALNKEAEENDRCQLELNDLIAGLPHESKLTNKALENIATTLQRLLWKHRTSIWKEEQKDDPLDVLHADTVLELLGFKFYRPAIIEPEQDVAIHFKVAGLIDKQQRFVQVSREFDITTQIFTTAHELGHALFHSQTILHRDRPFDGSSSDITRDRKEIQADKFASYFLMPEKQVRAVFKKLFSIDMFVTNSDNVFQLTNGRLSTFRELYPTRRDLSRFFAKPISEAFKVSEESMAIRLEELNLVIF